jgi:hypothetical protein
VICSSVRKVEGGASPLEIHDGNQSEDAIASVRFALSAKAHTAPARQSDGVWARRTLRLLFVALSSIALRVLRWSTE